jgi:hypothetical protein
MAENDQQQPLGGPGSAGDGEPDVDEVTAARAANRFDIRRIIGGLFLLYGLILAVVGAFGSDDIKNKAAGINVNLCTGLAMLVFGGLMIAWALLRPTVPNPEAARGQGSPAT